MALTATVHHFRIALSDVDRGVYETLELTVARHPSESARFLLTRTIAYCLLYEEGIAFTKGLSTADEPALWVRDLQGNLRVWIDVGSPSADRMHKASKAAPRVVVFTHHDPELLRKSAGERAIHKADRIEVYSLGAAFLDALDAVTEKRNEWALLRNDGQLYVTVGEKTIAGEVSRHSLVA